MRVAHIASLLAAGVSTATAASDRFAVTSVRLVEAPSRLNALSVCQSEPSAVSVGVGWGIGTNGGRVHLCHTRVRLDELQHTPTPVLQRIAVTSGASCPSVLVLLATPRANVSVCVGFASSDDESVAKYGDFVSDLAVTIERNYNSDSFSPAWTTIPVSLHTTGGASSPANRGVFLSVRRSVRPITDVIVVADAPAAASCQQVRMRDAGSYLDTSSTATKTLLCLQSPPLDETDSVVATAPKLSALTLSISGVCPDGSTKALPLSSTVTLCATFDASPVNWLSDVALHRVDAALGDGGDPTVREYLPGGFRLVNNTNLNRADQSPVFLFTRAYTSTQFEPSPAIAKPPLRAVAQPQSSLSFKILQLADLHFTGDPKKACRNAPTSVASCTEALMTTWINDLLDVEKPDFVAFTGDNVETFTVSRREPALNAVVQGVEARGIPYGMVFGNHDDENGFPREELVRLAASKNHSYTQRGPTQIDGVGNYELSVHAPVAGVWGGEGTEVFRMYFLDSHGYPDRAKYPLVNSAYDWVKPNQIEFYRNLSTTHATQGDRVPAIMFFHIPLVEYAANAATRTNGEQLEAVASSDVSTNLFSTLVDMGEVKATFCGHDHVNDYCYLREGVQLCYGGGAGFGQAYGLSAFSRRARVVEWSVNATGQRSLRSWKRHFDDLNTRKNEEVLYQE